MVSKGYEVGEEADPFVTLADKATEQFALSTSPSTFLVNTVPFRTYVLSYFFSISKPGLCQVQYVPEWVPGMCSVVLIESSLNQHCEGASFQKTAKEWASTLKEMVDLPYNFVKNQIVSVSGV